MTRPYADAADIYWQAGWRGVLPLPPKRKADPPKGYTGHDGLEPSYADVHAWTEDKPAGNIGLRMPDDVIGLDVDAYAGKVGGQTLQRYLDTHGPLPPTWRSTSRDDGVSSIRLYRVPPGRLWVTKLTGGGVEVIQRAHRYAVVWPSVHDKTGATYRWLTPEGVPSTRPAEPTQLPELPASWQDALARGAARTGPRTDLDDEQARAWLETLPKAPACPWVLKRHAAVVTALAGSSRHDDSLPAVLALLYAGAKGHPGVADSLAALRQAFLEAVVDDRPDEDAAKGEWRRIVVGGVARVLDDPPLDHLGGCDCPAPPVEVQADSPAGGLEELLEVVRTYLHLPDPRHLLVALACAVSVADERETEPLWVLEVGPPSGGKTEVLRLCDGVTDDRVDELTVGGLLSWSKAANNKPPKASGLLVRVGERGMATVKDFSTVLATSDRGGREQLFANLRAVYDGNLDRSIANPKSGEPLRWQGRLTLLAAVTPVIDEYTSHADALGPRWLYCRLPSTDSAHRRRAAGMARRGGMEEARRRATGLTTTLVEDARGRITKVELADEWLDALDDAAVVTCLGRASVPREPYGRRDICGVPVVEEPPRVVRQLGALARSLVALGLEAPDAVGAARLCALDTIPRARLVVLDALSLGEDLTVAEVARRTGLHRHVVRRALEDMQTVGVTTCPGLEADEDDDPANRAPRPWRLAGEDAPTVAAVLRAARAQERGTRCGDSTPEPPNKDRAEVDPGPTPRATSAVAS